MSVLIASFAYALLFTFYAATLTSLVREGHFRASFGKAIAAAGYFLLVVHFALELTAKGGLPTPESTPRPAAMNDAAPYSANCHILR